MDLCSAWIALTWPQALVLTVFTMLVLFPVMVVLLIIVMSLFGIELNSRSR